MIAIILAAGLGTRLQDLTIDKPKCMTEVNGKKIIDNQIESFIENKIEEIIIIGGCKFNVLKEHINNIYKEHKNIKLVNNRKYDKTNNMFSFYKSKKFIKKNDIILVNGDVFYDKTIVSDLIQKKGQNIIVSEKGLYNDESMKIHVVDNKIKEISKTIDKNKSDGCSIDMYLFNNIAVKRLLNIIKKDFLNKKNYKSWTEVAINELFSIVDVSPLYTKKKWCEIDNIIDLKQAEKLF